MNSIAIYASSIPDQAQAEWVPETRFGKWFVSTNIWIDYVLRDAVADLRYMIGGRLRPGATMLEAGCGIGLSFPLLDEHFQPKKIIGFDIDEASLQKAAATPRDCNAEIDLVHGTASHMEFPDNSFDLIFCHQLIHHVKDQPRVLKELYRVLAPGGYLLSSESCRNFIESIWVRLLFRHPKMVQKTADEYIQLMKNAGFEMGEHDVKKWVPWWSHVDFGLWEKLGLPPRRKEPTEILTVAQKPLK